MQSQYSPKYLLMILPPESGSCEKWLAAMNWDQKQESLNRNEGKLNMVWLSLQNNKVVLIYLCIPKY